VRGVERYRSKNTEGNSPMPRPHEDIQHHTSTDHRPGGPIIRFAPNAWWAIEVAHVAAGRAPAGVATYETLIEKARTSAPKVREAGVLRSHNDRRVIALLELDGHEAFRHLTAAWDDHHLFAERHAVAESRSLALYKVAATAGEAALDPTSTDVCAFEHVLVGAAHLGTLVVLLAAAPGFVGASIFGTDDDSASAIVYRFTHNDEIAAFRATPEALRALGPAATTGDTFYPVHAVRTFG
jgi:hypothetical protein